MIHKSQENTFLKKKLQEVMNENAKLQKEKIRLENIIESQISVKKEAS
jgi:regulator of replication initiation timing